MQAVITKEEVQAYVLSILGLVNNNDLWRKGTLVDDLGLDSLEIIDVIIQLESEFNISIIGDDEEAFGKMTIEEIVEFVRRKVEEQ